MKKFTPASIQALKNALTSIYWKKKDLRNFIYHSIENKSIIGTIDWDNNVKSESVNQLIERMLNREDIFKEDIFKLFYNTMNINDFSHLKYWEDSNTKIQRAKDSVAALKKHAAGFFSIQEEKKRAEDRKKAYSDVIKEKLSFQQQISVLRDSFYTITCEPNAQKRGYLLERFLNDLFTLHDLEPKESFKIVGEQIDGAFTFENQDYLLEAKWHKDPIQAGDLFDFGGKIDGKLKTALGLFISVNGFSKESTNVKSQIIRSMILMDGTDLMAILENRITLNDLLRRKRRHAVEKGEIFLPYIQMV